MAAARKPDPILGAYSWIKQREPGDQSDPLNEPSVTSRIVSESSSVFKVVLQHAAAPDSKVSPGTRRNLEESYSRLVLWADGYGVKDGAIDDVVAASRSLRRAVTELMVSISKTLSNGTSVVEMEAYVRLW
jgi:hypothetical protein